ncbi:MAG: CYTH domain-containing protein [Candidatus Aenigmatarchaeota archaeon]
MKEFEMRFKLVRDISGELARLGFEKKSEFESCDIIFEPREWNPWDDLKPGYFAVRIRLIGGRKPKLELKEYLEDNIWDEISLEISSPKEIVKLLLKIMNMRRCVLKHRIMWHKNSTEVCVDKVEHLGNFVEIEGEREDVYKTAELLNLDVSQKQPNYGAQLFYLERDGKLKFSADEIIKAAEKFMQL